MAYGCQDPDLIAAAPGTQILISMLPHLLPAADVTILSPTYGEHAPAWSAAGATVSEAGSLDALEDGEIAILSNPNNPDGRSVGATDLLALNRKRAAQNGVLIVDEAFAEFGEAHVSAAPMTPQPGLVVLRSFGKAYGLAGLRLGFLIGEQALVRRVEAALGPWPVSGISIHVACAALRDQDWRRRHGGRSWLRRASASMPVLSSAGIAVIGGTSLFRVGTACRSEPNRRRARAGRGYSFATFRITPTGSDLGCRRTRRPGNACGPPSNSLAERVVIYGRPQTGGLDRTGQTRGNGGSETVSGSRSNSRDSRECGVLSWDACETVVPRTGWLCPVVWCEPVSATGSPIIGGRTREFIALQPVTADRTHDNVLTYRA